MLLPANVCLHWCQSCRSGQQLTRAQKSTSGGWLPDEAVPVCFLTLQAHAGAVRGAADSPEGDMGGRSVAEMVVGAVSPALWSSQRPPGRSQQLTTSPGLGRDRRLVPQTMVLRRSRWRWSTSVWSRAAARAVDEAQNRAPYVPPHPAVRIGSTGACPRRAASQPGGRCASSRWHSAQFALNVPNNFNGVSEW